MQPDNLFIYLFKVHESSPHISKVANSHFSKSSLSNIYTYDCSDSSSSIKTNKQLYITKLCGVQL